MSFTYEADDDTDFAKINLAELAALPAPDASKVYRVTDTNQLVAWDVNQSAYRNLIFNDPVLPDFLDLSASAGVVDFRAMPDLTTLGVDMTGAVAVSPTSITGQISATLDATDGLKFTESKVHGWNNILAMRKIGAAVDSGKSLSFVCRGNGPMNNMIGLMGLHHDVDHTRSAHSYVDLMPSVYSTTAAGGRLYRVYTGTDSIVNAAGTVVFKNPAGANAYLESMNGKWWRGEISAMGIDGSTVVITEIDPLLAGTAGDLFGAAVETGVKLVSTLPANRGNTSRNSCFAFAGHYFNDGFDLMALRLA